MAGIRLVILMALFAVAASNPRKKKMFVISEASEGIYK